MQIGRFCIFCLPNVVQFVKNKIEQYLNMLCYSSASNRIVSAKDHASIQINFAEVHLLIMYALLVRNLDIHKQNMKKCMCIVH